MDSCYNPDNAGNSGPKNVGGSCGAGASYTCYASYSSGNVRLPFGLLYLLAENDIPVSIILNQTKTSLTEADFSITPPSGSSTATVSDLSAASSGYSVNSGGMKRRSAPTPSTTAACRSSSRRRSPRRRCR